MVPDWPLISMPELINNIKPDICYFYPLNYDPENPGNYLVKKHDICNGIFNGKKSEWKNIEKKYSEYYMNETWQKEMAEHWNIYYRNKSENDFIIFFYEELYPLYVEYLKKERGMGDVE